MQIDLANNRTRSIIAAIVVLAFAGGAWWRFYGRKGSVPEVYAVDARRSAPEFRLPDFNDTVHELRSFEGRPLIVHFWATWCAPCLAEIPDLIEFARGNPELQVVAISLDEGWPEVERMMPHEELPKNFTSVLDATKKTPDAFGTYQYPETYLLDREGKILMKWVGAQDWKSERTKSFLERILSEQSP
jgi:thiol-disulfide isomerase/thioredoxin